MRTQNTHSIALVKSIYRLGGDFPRKRKGCFVSLCMR